MCVKSERYVNKTHRYGHLKGPRTVSYSICPNFDSLWLGKCITDNYSFGYNINVLQQTACLVVNPITVGNFAFLFNCTQVGRTSDSMMVPT